MDEASKIALITGFGGVVLGGALTYLSEWNFRRQERKAAIKKNFALCLCEIERAVSHLSSVYKKSASLLPDAQPQLLSVNVRNFASLSEPPISLETEKMFSVNHKKDEIFSDLSLFFDDLIL